jgi:uncharacterized cupredoxin-like copper-binding protein
VTQPARAAIAIAAAGLLALTGCGEKRETGTGASTTAKTATQAAGPAAATVKVSETEFKLDPSSPKVAKAGVIEFKATNDGATKHALEIETPDGGLRTDPIEPGKSASLKADLKPGTYQWYCPIDGHKDKGMKGEIVVAGGGSGGSGGGTSTDNNGGGSSGGGGY